MGKLLVQFGIDCFVEFTKLFRSAGCLAVFLVAYLVGKGSIAFLGDTGSLAALAAFTSAFFLYWLALGALRGLARLMVPYAKSLRDQEPPRLGD